jgi:hypothetical protein
MDADAIVATTAAFPLLVSYDKVKLYDIPYEKDKIFLF